jgi:hypothetical protein
MDFRFFWIIVSGSFLLLSLGCGQLPGSINMGSTGAASAEPPYYGQKAAITGPTFTGKALAHYRYRALNFDPTVLTGCTIDPTTCANGLSTTINELEIAYAEFHIYDSSGNRVQQGETDASGYLNFDIPRTAGTYTMKVFSRASNDYIKVSVLADIYNNQPYSIQSTFTITQTMVDNTAIGSLTTPYDLTSSVIYAQADENISSSVEGGAFNIMHDILLANNYLRTQLSLNDSAHTTDPTKWFVADKVSVYWKAGFNPYTYFGSSSPLSFYARGERKLYILGGSNGDVKNSDTDHFDDSVIIHEYGHFMEDVYGHSESPGGSHNGNFIIDPRLAWSEGWANFFQGAVLTQDGSIPSGAAVRKGYYIDTYGYKSSSSDGNAGISIAFSLTDVGNSSSTKFDSTYSDPTSSGVFREVSISRTLYKTTRDATATYGSSVYGAGIPFSYVWKTFSDATVGMPSVLLPNSGAFNKNLSTNYSGDQTKWNIILTEEHQPTNTNEYASTVVQKSSSCSRSMTGVAEKILLTPRSDQIRDNDFFLYYYDGNSANGSIALNYSTTTTTTSGAAMDLDLIVYNSSYVYFEDAYWYAGQSSPYIARQSRRVASLDGGSESISLSGLAAGYYLINVKINAYNKITNNVNGTVSYDLKVGGNYLCP